MRLRVNHGYLLALGMVATAGVGVNYVSIVLNSYVRWVVLLAIFASVLVSNRLFAGLRGINSFLVPVFLFYCVLTTFWSEIPILSGSKSVLVLISAFSYSSAAGIWAGETEKSHVLDVLWPLVGLALVTGIVGSSVPTSSIRMNESITLYQGLAGNPNFLGILILVSLPAPLWVLARSQSTCRQRRLAYLILFLLLAILLTTVSRASILAVSIIFAFYLLARGAFKTAALLLLVGVTMVVALAAAPEIVSEVTQRFVFKSPDPNATLLHSRQDTFESSLEAARAGGAIGIGFGVSYGEYEYTFGQGSALYGREKGNISLALIEETGVLGFILFYTMIFAILASLHAALHATASREDRTLVLLLGGTLVALLVHAQFEAWLLSPGAAATPVFWAFVGIFYVIKHRIRKGAL